MIINSINLLPKIAFNIPKLRENGTYKNTGFNTENLAPLKKDTVSFSAARKLSGEYMIYAPSAKMCAHIHNNAYPAAYDMASVLKEYLEKSLDLNINLNSVLNFEPKQKTAAAKTSKKKNPITLKVRIKGADSIREKVVSKFGKTVTDDLKNFCNAAVSAICGFYSLQDGYTKEMAAIDAETLLETQYRGCAVSPSANKSVLADEITAALKRRKLIKFNGSAANEKEAAEQIKKRLEDFTSRDEYCGKHGTYLAPDSKEGIQYYANDIIGARIILNEPGKETAQKVLDALKQAAKDGKLSITSVENNLPASKKLPAGAKIGDYEYLSSRRIKAFADTVKTNYILNESKSGYIAIHVNLDLTKNKFASKKNELNGYQGEIQIMGADIEALKDVEDLCYKLKDEKNAFQEKYKPFKEYFKKYYRGQDVQDAFNSYTFDLYLAQRKLPPGRYSAFPSIKELGYEGRVPEELDFNELKKIKESCK